MGTTGSGTFGNYSPIQRDNCPSQISFFIEDFEISEYFLTFRKYSELDDDIFILDELINKRIVVVDKRSMKILGNVPTKFNYLYQKCIMQGKKYVGVVKYVSHLQITQVLVELNVQ